MYFKRYLPSALTGIMIFLSCENREHGPENKVFIAAKPYAQEIMVQTDENETSKEHDLSIGMVSPLDRDVTITLKPSPELLDNYRNGYYNSTARLLPMENCDFASLKTSIISKSVASAPVRLKFTDLDKLDWSTDYVMPLSICDSDGVPVLESGKTVYMVLSKAYLINVVADINDNLAWVDWKDKSQMGGMETFTMEVLINANTFTNETISTIMGIEDNFLIRIGDANYSKNMLNIAYGKKVPGQDLNARGSIKINKPLLETGRWYHIAVTFDKGKIDVYLDGELAGGCEQAIVDNGEVLANVDFTTGESVDESGRPDENGGRPRAFWFGYSYTTDDPTARDFDGMIAEARIWNRALTSSEINSENHFWKVSPDSEGLVAYWKFNDNSGNIVKDHSGYANNLKADHAFLWVGVDLPKQ